MESVGYMHTGMHMCIRVHNNTYKRGYGFKREHRTDVRDKEG